MLLSIKFQLQRYIDTTPICLTNVVECNDMMLALADTNKPGTIDSCVSSKNETQTDSGIHTFVTVQIIFL